MANRLYYIDFEYFLFCVSHRWQNAQTSEHWKRIHYMLHGAALLAIDGEWENLILLSKIALSFAEELEITND